MKKVCRIIKLRKYKSFFDKETIDKIEGHDFIVCFSDSTFEWCISKDELTKCLEKDHIKRIRYIFDMSDRISINRDVLIDTSEI